MTTEFHVISGEYQNELRLSVLNNLSLIDRKFRQDKSELLDTYMNALLKEIHQKYPVRHSKKEASSEKEDQTSEVERAHHAGEAKKLFSFYCKQINSYARIEGLTVLPFLYLSASTIHASFAEHFVRVLWECFRFENLAMAMYWLVGFMCNTSDVIGFPLVKDTLRHLSVYLCMILKKTNLTPQSKKEESPECSKDRLNFVAGFYVSTSITIFQNSVRNLHGST